VQPSLIIGDGVRHPRGDKYGITKVTFLVLHKGRKKNLTLPIKRKKEEWRNRLKEKIRRAARTRVKETTGRNMQFDLRAQRKR